MKLLIITQKIDKEDPILGFFHAWVKEFSKYFDNITVICLYKGKYDLPSNVRVFSLGKESGEYRLKYIFNFYKYIWKERKNYDKVFVHMNQIYVLLGGFIWKIFNKEVYLWYTHKSVTQSLKLSLIFIKNVFSASKESFRVQTSKLKVMGHGIDLDLFTFENNKKYTDGNLNLVTVGRISRSKDLLTIINAIKVLKEKINIKIQIIGGTLTNDDNLYFDEINRYINDNNLSKYVEFLGSMSQDQILPYIKSADIFIHASSTGSLDKAALESLVCGTLVISSNDALLPILSKYNLVFKEKNVQDLVNTIETFMNIRNKNEISLDLYNLVNNSHSLTTLIKNLSTIIISNNE